MASLTQISVTTRKMIVAGVIALIVYFILRIFVSLAIQYYKATHQPPPAPPNVRFGQISKIEFPPDLKTSKDFKFILQNVEGRPPETTMSGKVYIMPKKLPNFQARERTLNLAKNMGFTDDPEINNTLYTFIHPKDPLYQLQIDSITQNFNLLYDYKQSPDVLFGETPASKDQAINAVKKFLQQNNLFDDEILTGQITTELLSYDRNQKKFINATSLSNSQAVRVDFFRKDLDKYKILTPEFRRSFNYAIFTKTKNSLLDDVVEASYYYWPINFEEFGTYPLISGTDAYQNLVDGNAVIADMGQNTSDTIIIRKIYLAYYDSKTAQMYLQPVFVFEGDNDFAAYYPALSPDWQK